MRFVSFEMDSKELASAPLHSNGGLRSQSHLQALGLSYPNEGMHSQLLSTNGSNGPDGTATPSRTSSVKERFRQRGVGAEPAENGHFGQLERGNLQQQQQQQQQQSFALPDATRLPVPSAANILRESPRQLVSLDLQEDEITFEVMESPSPRFTHSPSEQVVAHILSPTSDAGTHDKEGGVRQ